VLLYAWGHLNDYAFVRCEVKCIKIPSNLHDALQTLRNSNHSVVLWADSICVDQHSSLEKNSQVALMGRIYQRASGVTDWLGTNKDGVSSSAFALARQIARHEHPSIPRKSTDIKPRRSVLNDLEWYALIEYADASGITTLDAEERSFWTALVDVYRRSWFTKVATDRVRRRMSIMSVASWGENHNKISVSIQIIGRSSTDWCLCVPRPISPAICNCLWAHHGLQPVPLPQPQEYRSAYHKRNPDQFLQLLANLLPGTSEHVLTPDKELLQFHDNDDLFHLIFARLQGNLHVLNVQIP
jgi:hypothetical protein